MQDKFWVSPPHTFIPLHSWLLRNCSIDAVVTKYKVRNFKLEIIET